eukprot:103566_1
MNFHKICFRLLVMGTLPFPSAYEPLRSSEEKKLMASYLTSYYLRHHYEEKQYSKHRIPDVIYELIVDIMVTFELNSDKRIDNDDALVYHSAQRGGCYNTFRILWCGCCDPVHRITTKYITENRWEGMSQVCDNMAIENIGSAKRIQTGCNACMSCCPLICCIQDMGTIVVRPIYIDGYPDDPSDQRQLHQISHSTQTCNNLNALIKHHDQGKRVPKWRRALTISMQDNQIVAN